MPLLLVRGAGALSLTPSHITVPGPPSLTCPLPHTPPTWVPRPAQVVYPSVPRVPWDPAATLEGVCSHFKAQRGQWLTQGAALIATKGHLCGERMLGWAQQVQ